MARQHTWRWRRLHAAGGVARTFAVEVAELDSGAPGPVVTVLGGVHGDEPEGMIATARLAREVGGLERGMLRLVPVAHEAAAQAASRVSPVDGLNLARVFPGDPGGTATERLAATITDHALAASDLVVDLHTAGLHYDMPLFAGCVRDGSDEGERSYAAARATGLPLLWTHPAHAPGRSLAAAASIGAAAIYVESPGGGMVSTGTVDAYVTAVRGLLACHGMTPASPGDRPAATVEEVHGGGDLDRDVIRAPDGGFFVRAVEPGATIEAGRSLGELWDHSGSLLRALVVPRAGRVMYLRRTAHVDPGDAVACVATPAGPESVP